MDDIFIYHYQANLRYFGGKAKEKMKTSLGLLFTSRKGLFLLKTNNETTSQGLTYRQKLKEHESSEILRYKTHGGGNASGPKLSPARLATAEFC